MVGIIDGKGMAHARILRMRDFVVSQQLEPKLTALTMNPNAATQQFLRIKQKIARDCGVSMNIVEIPLHTTHDRVVEIVKEVAATSDGVVIQIPFPPHIDIDNLLSVLPSECDPDCMGHEATQLLDENRHVVLPPVVAAIRAICTEYDVSPKDKKVVVVGQGRLVGVPAARWFEQSGADVVRLTKDSGDIKEYTHTADIIVLGAGSPSLLTPDMISLNKSVSIFDAGTSEEGGRLVGDADPACSEFAYLTTPVPGGIGPLAVAFLFENMLKLKFDFV